MRNILEHPLTDDEIVQYLERLQREVSDKYLAGDGPVGSLDGVIVATLIDRVKAKTI